MQDNDSVVYIDLPDREQGGASVLFEADWGKPEDAAFVAAAPRLLRALLTALREARAREAQLRNKCDGMAHGDVLTLMALERGQTDCSTPAYIRAQNVVEQLETAERERDTLRAQLQELQVQLADASRHGAREALEKAADTFRVTGPMLSYADGRAVDKWLRTRATQEAGDQT